MSFVGLMDPPRAEARQAIAECRQAGIAVKMITGDHQTTASVIASELGLRGRAVSGTELDRMDGAQLAAAIDEIAGARWRFCTTGCKPAVTTAP